MLISLTVNAILGNHNVDKQMTDSRGEVSSAKSSHLGYLESLANVKRSPI
jgi:hypothetical protein